MTSDKYIADMDLGYAREFANKLQSIISSKSPKALKLWAKAKLEEVENHIIALESAQ